MSCRRSSGDPLIRLLTDRYRLNILRVPRAGIAVGDLFVMDAGDLSRMGRLAGFFDPELTIPAGQVDPLAPQSGSLSTSVSASLMAEPLAGFLTAMGIAGVSDLSAKLQVAREAQVTFEVTGATLETIDVVELGQELSGRVLSTDNALYRPDREFYVAHAVARATGLDLGFTAERTVEAELSAEVEQLAKASAAVTTHRAESGAVVVQGDVPLAFGVAVLQLTLDGDQLRLDLPDGLHPVRSLGSTGTPKEIPSVLVGDQDGAALLELSGAEALTETAG